MRGSRVAWWLVGGFATAYAVSACMVTKSDADPTADAGPDASELDAASADASPLDASALDAAQGDASSIDSGSDASAPPASWTLRSHDCPNINRTDDLLDEGAQGLWVGCGSGATGTGLYHSANDGETWTQVVATGVNTLETFRVNSIDRGPDGALYVGGIEVNAGGHLVLRVDQSGAGAPVTSAVLTSVNQVGYQFIVGNFRQLSTGAALAESLNGTDALFRADASVAATATSWTTADPAVTGGITTQILDLVVHNDRFYGAGGVINSPPYAFVPKADATSVYDLQAIELPRAGGSWTGEAWGIAVSDAHIVVVGANQRDNTGRIYVSGPTPTAALDFTEHDLSVLYGDPAQRTWARGACADGARLVVVGEKQPLRGDTGLVFQSLDGGQTFEDITPEGVSATVSKCSIREDGTLVIAGASQVGFYR